MKAKGFTWRRADGQDSTKNLSPDFEAVLQIKSGIVASYLHGQLTRVASEEEAA